MSELPRLNAWLLARARRLSGARREPLLQRLKPVVVREPQQRFVRHLEHLRIRRGAMAYGVPAGRDEGVATLPRKVLVADRGFARPFGHVEDDVSGGAIAAGVAADRQPFHR